jgi:hypothetical protein
MRWVDEITNRERLEELFFREEIFLIRWFNHLIRSTEFYLITSSFYSSCMNDSITNRICLFETIRIVKFFINMLTSNRVVLQSFSRDDLFKLRWFLSYLLIFEIVEKSMSTKMNMRFWWNQTEVTMKLENSLCYVITCKKRSFASKRHVQRTHFVFCRFARHDDKFVTRLTFVTRIVWFTKLDDNNIAFSFFSNSFSYMKRNSSRKIWAKSEAIDRDV